MNHVGKRLAPLLFASLLGCELSRTVSIPSPADPVSPWPNSTIGWKLPVGSVAIHDIEMHQGDLHRRGLMVSRVLSDTVVGGSPASVTAVFGYFADSGEAFIWREGTTAIYAYHPEGIFEYDRKDYWPDLFPAGLFRAAARTFDTANFGYVANLLAYPMSRNSDWDGIDTSFFPRQARIRFRSLGDSLVRTGPGLALCLGIRGTIAGSTTWFDRWIDRSGLARSEYHWTFVPGTMTGNVPDSIPGGAVAIRVSTDSSMIDTLRTRFFERVFGAP